eukprot:TRINITY_DN14741_c0_g1_i1.p1 TRINITY_DN14741_c0_g1~~TRINITY_DN14741_c0_g1_i1.p1  ORF type:complete len:354 (+),score=84.22 TRINITY_DN14741_c0_g1_i1:57-1064(+)
MSIAAELAEFLLKAALAAGGSAALAYGYMLWCWRGPFKGIRYGNKSFEAMSAVEKMETLYDRCAENKTNAKWPSLFAFLYKLYYKESFHPTFTYFADELYPGQFKGIHTVGGVCKAVFESTMDHPYTGLLASPANPVVFRMSQAVKPTNKNIPGIALKFLRGTLPSVNVVALHSFDGVEGGNFFSRSMSNHIPLPTPNLITKKFGYFAKFAQTVGLSELAEAEQDGVSVEVGKRVFPFQLQFIPNPELQNNPAWRDLPVDVSLEAIYKEIPAETVLFTVLAVEEPNAPAKKIGVIRTKSAIIPSQYGDTKLFFRHTAMETDLALRPEWRAAVPDS